jgi:hypothetical protein
MINDAEVAGTQLVLEYGSIWNMNRRPFNGNDDDCSFECHISANGDVARDGEVCERGKQADQQLVSLTR